MENKRRGKAYNKKKKNKFFTKTRVLIGLLIIVILLIVSAVYLYVSQIVIPTQISQNQPLSILVVGTDSSEFRDQLWDEGDKATLTDSLMVVTFNPNRYRFEVTSIPRDTSVDYVCESLPDYQDQINEVYYLSGYDMNCLEETVENFLDVPIDYNVMLDFDTFKEIIDQIGGIDIVAHAADGTLSQGNELNDTTYYWVDGEEYHMDGDEALTYARARHDSEKDYGRGIRQQQVVAATLRQALNSDLSFDLISSMFGMVSTNMPLKIAYDYYNFLDVTDTISEAIIGEDEVDYTLMPERAWQYMFEWFDYPDASGKVNQDKVNEFEVYLKENFSDEEIAQYFFRQHQFYNETYSGHYNVVKEQLQTITDALRENLELEPVTVEVPSKSYGDNEGSGLIPTEWATGSGASSGVNSSGNSSSETTAPEPETTEPETTEPEPTEPEPTDPDTTEPEPTDPDTTDPDTTDPDTTDPDTTDPDTTDPDTTDPDTTDPETTE